MTTNRSDTPSTIAVALVGSLITVMIITIVVLDAAVDRGGTPTTLRSEPTSLTHKVEYCQRNYSGVAKLVYAHTQPHRRARYSRAYIRQEKTFHALHPIQSCLCSHFAFGQLRCQTILVAELNNNIQRSKSRHFPWNPEEPIGAGLSIHRCSNCSKQYHHR